MAGIYYDEGISGTKKDTRPGLNQMLKDCRDGKIDLILTKSISRFARNTTDCISMVRALTAMNVNLIFEKENIDTRTMDSEFILTILSSLAEEESHDISTNETWTYQKQFKSGTYRYKRAPYGYKLKDGNFVIVEKKAEILRWIFDQVLEGKGQYLIAKELNARGIPSPYGKKWCSSTVGGLIKNPACKGDVLMAKTYKDETCKVIHNFEEKPQYYMEDHHPAIIDAETWQLANDALIQRGKEKGNVKEPPEIRVLHINPHINQYCFTRKLVCGCCGSDLVRCTDYVKSGKRYYWTCVKHVADKESCALKRVLEDNIQNAFMTMLNKLYYASDIILDPYCRAIAAAAAKEDEKRLSEISTELKKNTEQKHRLSKLQSTV